LNLKTIA